LLVELRGGGARAQAEISGERENRPVLSFRDMLARELHQNLNGDIVRHASILLRDGGEGLIRLSLKPESLGNVKIRLEMTENKVTGHILVESDEALRAFEREIHVLEQAFRDSGFEGADLDIAFAPEGGQPGGERREREGDAPFLRRLAASGYDAAGETLSGESSGFSAGPYGQGQTRINLLV
jgi:flagellar hook-length control protein FliK